MQELTTLMRSANGKNGLPTSLTLAGEKVEVKAFVVADLTQITINFLSLPDLGNVFGPLSGIVMYCIKDSKAMISVKDLSLLL